MLDLEREHILTIRAAATVDRACLSTAACLVESFWYETVYPAVEYLTYTRADTIYRAIRRLP